MLEQNATVLSHLAQAVEWGHRDGAPPRSALNYKSRPTLAADLSLQPAADRTRAVWARDVPKWCHVMR